MLHCVDDGCSHKHTDTAIVLMFVSKAKVEKVGIKDHAVMDEHVGGGGGVEIAKTMFTKYPNYTMGAVNAETNAGIHTMSRAMMEANDLNDWFNCADPWCTRLHFRTASFCTERSGHFDAFDQGISFFLPNMTWLQPPGYVSYKSIQPSVGLYERNMAAPPS